MLTGYHNSKNQRNFSDAVKNIQYRTLKRNVMEMVTLLMLRCVTMGESKGLEIFVTHFRYRFVSSCSRQDPFINF